MIGSSYSSTPSAHRSFLAPKNCLRGEQQQYFTHPLNCRNSIFEFRFIGLAHTLHSHIPQPRDHVSTSYLDGLDQARWTRPEREGRRAAEVVRFRSLQQIRESAAKIKHLSPYLLTSYRPLLVQSAAHSPTAVSLLSMCRSTPYPPH